MTENAQQALQFSWSLTGDTAFLSLQSNCIGIGLSYNGSLNNIAVLALIELFLNIKKQQHCFRMNKSINPLDIFWFYYF